MDDYAIGLAYGNRKRSEGAEQAVSILAKGLDDRDDRITELNDRVAKLEAQVAMYRRRAAIGESDAAGKKAQIEALIAQHPTSPLNQNSGVRFKDGSVKKKIRLIYEAAFDAVAKTWGITDPASNRIN